jgi:hypothetical protein
MIQQPLEVSSFCPSRGCLNRSSDEQISQWNA